MGKDKYTEIKHCCATCGHWKIGECQSDSDGVISAPCDKTFTGADNLAEMRPQTYICLRWIKRN